MRSRTWFPIVSPIFGTAFTCGTVRSWILATAEYRRNHRPFHAARTARPRARCSPRPVPALLIGRLAVDQAFGGIGLGSAMVRHVLATTLELNQSAACKAGVATALHDHAQQWWLRMGFDPFDEGSLDLCLLTKDIARTLG